MTTDPTTSQVSAEDRGQAKLEIAATWDRMGMTNEDQMAPVDSVMAALYAVRALAAAGWRPAPKDNVDRGQDYMRKYYEALQQGPGDYAEGGPIAPGQPVRAALGAWTRTAAVDGTADSEQANTLIHTRGPQEGKPVDETHTESAAPLGSALCSPEYHVDYNEDGVEQDPSVIWGLSWGCTVSFGYMDGQLRAIVNMSDRDKQAGITARKVTPEQIAAYARHLLHLADEPLPTPVDDTEALRHLAHGQHVAMRKLERERDEARAKLQQQSNLDELREGETDIDVFAKRLFDAQYQRQPYGRALTDPKWSDLEPFEQERFRETVRSVAWLFGPLGRTDAVELAEARAEIERLNADIARLDRSLGIASQESAERQARIDKALALHNPKRGHQADPDGCCFECGDPMPCDTVEALSGATPAPQAVESLDEFKGEPVEDFAEFRASVAECRPAPQAQTGECSDCSSLWEHGHRAPAPQAQGERA